MEAKCIQHVEGGNQDFAGFSIYVGGNPGTFMSFWPILKLLSLGVNASIRFGVIVQIKIGSDVSVPIVVEDQTKV